MYILINPRINIAEKKRKRSRSLENDRRLVDLYRERKRDATRDQRNDPRRSVPFDWVLFPRVVCDQPCINETREKSFTYFDRFVESLTSSTPLCLLIFPRHENRTKGDLRRERREKNDAFVNKRRAENRSERSIKKKKNERLRDANFIILTSSLVGVYIHSIIIS